MSYPPSEAGASRWGSPALPSGPMGPPPKTRSRTHSISSDRPSTVAYSIMSPPLSVSPEAAFIAAAAASQIVTNDHDAHAATWYDQQGVEPPTETVLVSRGALALVNGFLDHLLFNFLSSAGSTRLAALRPAVTDVLKPKLASDAMNQADEELREYLGGEDDDQGAAPSSSPRDWDLELIWKRTRLRCMVYSSLGDLEEEDEDFYMESEDLVAANESDGTVSPAVAIFLTSILEFMGEQALVVAGATASQRMRTDYEKGLRDGGRNPGEVVDRIVVEDSDMERVALDRTLGRLWRSWKKKKMVRSPRFSQDPVFGARPYSRGSLRPSHSGHFRGGSLGIDSPRNTSPRTTATEEFETFKGRKEKEPEHGANTKERDIDEQTLAASVPLPIGPDDVTEILVPGLAHYADDDDETHLGASSGRPRRPKSMMVFTSTTGVVGLPTPADSQPHTPLASPRKRSNSLPTFATFTSSMDPPNKRAKTEAPLPADVDNKSQGAGEDKRAQTTLKHMPVLAPPSPALSEDLDSRANIDPGQMEMIKGRRKSSAEISAMIAGATGGATSRLALDLKFSRPSLDEVDEIDEFSEEPQILTSSRVSISGRSTSPTASVHERNKSKPAITIGIPTRTPSVHSVRMIEVNTPRSPVSRSRNSSADAQERSSMRSSNVSRTDSFSTPPIREEKRQGSPSKKAFPFPAGKPSRVHNDSISEAEEIAGMASKQSSDGGHEASHRAQASDPDFDPVPRQASRSPARTPPTSTKATIVQSAEPSTSTGTFFIDERPEVPPKSSPVGVSRAAPPALPERSSYRTGGSGPSSPVERSTVGVVSIERASPPRSAASESPREQRLTPTRSQEQPSPSSRRPHESAPSVSSIQTRRKPVRSSQDSASRDSAVTPEEVARNFEELMKSNETKKFTLTPESMRDTDSIHSIKVESPAGRPKSRKSEDVQSKLGHHARSSSQATTRAKDSRRTPSISQSTGLNSHPVAAYGTEDDVKLSGPVPRAPAGMGSRARVAGPIAARDARVPRESLADFADFIRGTGPPGAAPRVREEPAPMTMSGAAGNGDFDPTVAGPSLTRSSTVGSAQSRQRHQARAAIVDPREDNSDLIDFIRRGPPSTSNNPRIPRTVAPFRSTMDSDQFATAAGGRAVDATIPEIRNSASAASFSVTERSLPSSINSSSALLRDKAAASGRNGSGAGTWDEDDMVPKRKQRRVRDPYAIDSDDEEDLEDEPTPRLRTRQPQHQASRPTPPPPQEESLADFLRNVPPPPPQPTTTLPFNLSGSQYARPTAPKKKSSTQSLMARFSRSRDHGDRSPKAPAESIAPAPASRAGGGRGYVPIQINMPPGVGDSSLYGTRPGSVGGVGGGVRPLTSGARVPMKKFEPRDPVMVPSRGTSDLADFLRSSEPPADFAGPRFAEQEAVGGGGGFGRRLVKRK